MLEKWLKMNITASWRKLFTVIESPAVSGHDQLIQFTLAMYLELPGAA